MTNTSRSLVGLAVAVVFSLAGCGGGGGSSSGNSGNSGSGGLTQGPVIPTTQAKAPVASPAAVPAVTPAAVDKAILRHVHRNTAKGNLLPDGKYIDSNNAKVERRGPFGLYIELGRNADNTYVIEREDNGLAYFRVTNTKPNGKVRIHNFYGVPTGYYLSFDSTDAEDKSTGSPADLCRKVDIRGTDVPAAGTGVRLLINGRVQSGVKYANNQSYVEDVTLCPVDGQHYLAVIARDDGDGAVRYGFNFYRDLKDGDVIELALAHDAEMAPWKASKAIDNEFDLAGIRHGWSREITLYKSPENSAQNTGLGGNFPKFNALALDTYRFRSDTTDLSVGNSNVHREFSADLAQVNFTVSEIRLADITATPLAIRWESVGADAPKLVSGVMFNAGLTQTYAFMSMDPEVLSERQFDYPVDDLKYLVDTAFSGVTGAAGIGDGEQGFVGDAALMTGFLYWPNRQGISGNNADLFLTADLGKLLKFLLSQSHE